MNDRCHDPSSTVLLTTPERFGLYEAVIGAGADIRFDPDETQPLDAFLCNCARSGGRLVILDEAHFIEAAALARGLSGYLDDAALPSRPLDFIVVCAEREPGDRLLSFLATYCGIYDIIYACEGPRVTVELARLLKAPNQRRDVLELIRPGELPCDAGGLSEPVPRMPSDRPCASARPEAVHCSADDSQIVEFDMVKSEKVMIKIEIQCI